MKNITISDIAVKAGVSKATVSRVLNSPEMVEGSTRERIESIMKEYNYTPSATAQNLSKRVSSTVGVIVPEISNSFFGTLFSGIEEITNKNGLSLLYCSNEDNEKKDRMALDLMRTQRVRGVLYVPAANYPAMGKKKKVIAVSRKISPKFCFRVEIYSRKNLCLKDNVVVVISDLLHFMNKYFLQS